ncbi:MAG: ATP-binding protein [Clostridia bacterium]
MFDALESIYSRIRAEEQDALKKRVSSAYARAPRLNELDDLRTQLLSEVGARRLTAAESIQRLNDITGEERSILRMLNLPEDELSLHYRCVACRDTGYLGTANRRPCACRLQKRELLTGETGINSRETFLNFSMAIYRDEAQAKRTEKAKLLCQAYAAALPSPEKPNLLILGMSGLGKSFLGNAICYEAISQGIDACRVTAYRFLQDMLSDIREHTSFAHRYTNVTLLTLDDLGSEPDIPNVSREWLFAVINERMLNQNPTVYLTNFSLSELQTRYGERVMSRLCDRTTTTALRLSGENLRM